MRRAAAALVAAVVGLTGLGGAGCTAEDVFVGERKLDECDGNWPVCTYRAGCNLNVREYVEGQFPGSRRFIVETEGRADIRVTMLFLSQVSPGADTEIHWYEPGCFERYSYTSDGADLFREAGSSGIFERERTVYRGGDHLIEVFSDAVADFLLKIEVNDADGQGDVE